MAVQFQLGSEHNVKDSTQSFNSAHWIVSLLLIMFIFKASTEDLRHFV